MSVYESLVQAREDARKAHEEAKLGILQVTLAAIKNEGIQKMAALSDEEVQAVVARQIKQLKDALVDFEAGKRQDLIDQTNSEVGFLQSFLPEQMSREEVEVVVKKVIEEMKPAGSQDFGKVMGRAMAELKGRADGQVVREIVQGILK